MQLIILITLTLSLFQMYSHTDIGMHKVGKLISKKQHAKLQHIPLIELK